MEWRGGKLYIDAEDQAQIMRELAATAPDGETAAELRRAARESDAKAADPKRPVPVIRHANLSSTRCRFPLP